MSYKTQSQIDIENSPLFAVRHWRNIPQETEDSLEDFLFWLEYNREDDIPSSDLEDITALINEFLGRDPKKIKQGEQELMQAWIKACKKETK